MGKKSIFIGCLICFVWQSAIGQSAFDEKLRSLYRNTVPLIKVEELKNDLQKNERLILLDTRALEEYNVSHLPTAKFVDYQKFKQHDLDTLDRQTPIIVYCSVGYRSERIGEKLIARGFKNVKNLYGGIFEWVNTGNRVVDNDGRPTLKVHTYNKKWSQWLLKGIKVY
jgi:rhodanese-related sulfurtransferase